MLTYTQITSVHWGFSNTKIFWQILWWISWRFFFDKLEFDRLTLVYDRNHLFGLGSYTKTETENCPKLLADTETNRNHKILNWKALHKGACKKFLISFGIFKYGIIHKWCPIFLSHFWPHFPLNPIFTLYYLNFLDPTPPLKSDIIYERSLSVSSWESKVGNICFFSPLVLSKWEDLAFSVCIKVCLFFKLWTLKCTIMANKT